MKTRGFAIAFLLIALSTFVVLLTPHSVHAAQDVVVGSDVPQMNVLAGKIGTFMMVVGGILFVGALLLQRWAPRRKVPMNPIRIAARQTIGQRQMLMVVECEEKRLLLAVSPQSVQLITELENSADGIISGDDFSQMISDRDLKTSLLGNG